jgi:hypothetical protein
MVVEMHAGLASDGGSKLKMLLTFVDALPTGYLFLRFSLSPPRPAPTSSSLPLLVCVPLPLPRSWPRRGTSI